MTQEEVARICHAAVRGMLHATGITGYPPWHQAPQLERESMIRAVQMHWSEDVELREVHAAWLEQVQADGWELAEVLDVANKKHPYVRPYDEIPLQHRVKDKIIQNIVQELRPPLAPPSTKPPPQRVGVHGIDGFKGMGDRS